MLEQKVRPLLQTSIIEPFARFLIRYCGATANRLSLIALSLGILVVPCMLLGLAKLAVTFMWLSGLFDVLDGTVARLEGSSSDIGTILDIMIDRAVEFAIVFGFYLVHSNMWAWVALLLLGSILFCVTSFLTVGILSNNVSEKRFDYSPGLIERAEAFVFFSVMILFPKTYVILSLLLCALILYTTCIRILEFGRREIS